MKDLTVIKIAVLVLTIEIWAMKKLLLEFTEALLEGGLREAPNMNITHIEVTKKIDMVVHTIHLLKMFADIHATPHKVMLSIEVELYMPLPVIMDTTLIPLVEGIMVITVDKLVVIVAPQMIHME